MFFLPHNLCCSCRKRDNPVWSHRQPQWNEKTQRGGKRSANIINSLWIRSVIPLCCQSYWSVLMFTYRSTHGHLVESVRISNLLRWKTSRPCGFSRWEDLYCSSISKKHKEKKACFSLHSTLNSGVMTEDCHSSSIVCVGKKSTREKVQFDYFLWFRNQPTRL